MSEIWDTCVSCGAFSVDQNDGTFSDCIGPVGWFWDGELVMNDYDWPHGKRRHGTGGMAVVLGGKQDAITYCLIMDWLDKHISITL